MLMREVAVLEVISLKTKSERISIFVLFVLLPSIYNVYIKPLHASRIYCKPLLISWRSSGSMNTVSCKFHTCVSSNGGGKPGLHQRFGNEYS